MTRSWPLLLALPLTLAGCPLIPQPDTPPIPPGAPSASKTGMGAGPATRPSPTAAERNTAEDAAVASSPMASTMPMPAPSAAAGGKPENAGSLISNNAGGLVPAEPSTMPPTFTSPTQEGDPAAIRAKGTFPGDLTVNFSGAVPKEVWLVAVDGSAMVRPTLDADGFTLGLAAGDYWLEIVEGDTRLRSRTPLSVPAGGKRTLEVVVEAERLVVEETVPLDAQPTPEPSPTGTPTP